MCTSPLTISVALRSGGKRSYQVPCGKCSACVRYRQNSWKIRCIEESKSAKYTYFFTLTYRDDVVPRSEFDEMTVSKVDVQNWLKRCRIAFKRSKGFDANLRYFITSEYGPKHHRPHYHGLFFTDMEFEDVSKFFADWEFRFGFTTFSLAYSPSATACYSSKYAVKDLALVDDLVSAGKCDKSFILVSKGLGSAYVDEYRRFHRSNWLKDDSSLLYADGSFNYRLPRYYYDKIFFRPVERDALRWSKTKNCFVPCKVKVPCKITPLSLKLSSTFQHRNDELYLSELASIQAKRHCSRAEAVHYVDVRDLSFNKRKAQDETARAVQFYEKRFNNDF